MKSGFVRKVIFRVMSLYGLSILAATCVFIIFIFVSIKKDIESEISNDYQLAEKVIRQYYLLGDIVSIRSYLDLWSETRNVSANFIDSGGDLVWSSRLDKRDGFFKSFPISFDNGSKIGILNISKSTYDIYYKKFSSYAFASLIIFIMFISFILIFHIALTNALEPLLALKDDLVKKSISLGLSTKYDFTDEIDEIRKLFFIISNEWENEKHKSEVLAIQAQTVRIASQVSHDIRSPLSALSMALYGLSSIPEERRILIRNAVQRINDIANDLLEKSKSSKLGLTTIVISSIDQMSPLIDSLVSEKRTQFRDKSNVDISVDLQNSYGLFAKININEFKRVLSNLINNSVEAENGNEKTIINVSVFSDKNSVVIQITDNGKGIPQHILSKLGTQEITSGKNEAGSGNGLGVIHAKKTIESFGGELKIKSTINVGTIIKIYLPIAETPDWFVKKLFLEQGMNFITFDDDISIHQIWSGRLSSLQVSKQNITHFSFSNPKDFKEKVPALLKQKCILLVDYEIISEKNNGLDYIEQIAEQNKSILKSTILVTSRYEESHIKERCEKLGIKMIPKAMAGYVPIEIIQSKQTFDAILLDDDMLVHECWKMYAAENKKSIKQFTNVEEFMQFLPTVDLQTKIYVDSNLGPNSSLKGEDILRKINTMGYQSLYLCTGYESEQFADIQFIKAVVGKEPKF